MEREGILIVDFGSQYTQLIARRIRELGVYSSVVSHNNKDIKDWVAGSYVKGVILSGGPDNVLNEDSATLPEGIVFDKKAVKPILGICYGMQLLAKKFGCKLEAGHKREYGLGVLKLVKSSSLLDETYAPEGVQTIWLSHGVHVETLSEDFELIASSEAVKNTAIQHKREPIWCVQFHPEVEASIKGERILSQFVMTACKAKKNWESGDIIRLIHEEASAIKGHAILALSGGVDSSVCAFLLKDVLKERLHCIFVDHGLLRHNEAEQVKAMFKDTGIDLQVIDAKATFFNALKGVEDSERKRKIIGGLFIDAFDQAAQTLKQHYEVDYLIQGTIYPDVIESGGYGKTHVIKSHHNVGGLPKNLQFKLFEPIRHLFKDEVRRVGIALGMHANFIGRHPFPGPGLAIRCPGEVTEEKIELLKKADFIFIEELHKENLYSKIWQAFAVILPVKSVGVMGDERSYDYTCWLRAVYSVDGMTADCFEFEPKFLKQVARRIVNEVRGINRVGYDYTSKPPATIEWE